MLLLSYYYAKHSKEIGMTIYARQPIAAGDTIYHSYAREFTTTTFRRLILFSGIVWPMYSFIFNR